LGATEREALQAGGEDPAEFRWLTDILDLMPVGLLLVEPDTARVLYANRTADELAGGEFPRATGSGEFSALYRVTDRDGRPLTDDEHPGVRAARGEQLDGVEVDWHTPDGVRSLLISSLSVPAVLGRPAMAVLSFKDATELRARETKHERLYEDAQASQRRAVEALALLDALFLRAPAGLAFFDTSLRYVRVNQALAAMNGVPVRDHIGRTVAEVLPDHGALGTAFRQVLDTGEPIDGLEYSGETPARPGERRHWRGSFYPVLDEDGAVLGLGAVVLDTTDAKLAAQAREQALTAERAERERAERAERRARFLAEAQGKLGESLDYTETLENFTRIVVPERADWCTIDMVQADNRVARVAVASADPATRSLAWEVSRRWPISLDGPGIIARVLRTGLPEMQAEIDSAAIDAAARNPEHAELLREQGPVSTMTVPLRVRGRVFGAVQMTTSQSGVRYSEEDLELAQELAARAAVAVDNARLFSSSRAIAHTLQESLLPPHLPAIRGLELAARYRAAGEGIEVGGDFYDVFAIRDDTWALVIGDVCGKGAEAAALTALMRYTVRAAAMDEDDPSRVLGLLNEAIMRQRADGRFSTAVFVRADIEGDGVALTLTSGGHPLPVVVRADGSALTVGSSGTLLGVLPEVTHVDDRIRLRSGDALILYTDGLTEAGAPSRVMTPEALVELAGSCAGLDADEIARRIEEHAVALQSGAARDDLALLVARVP
jgi:serine phosphatase RsbU (regulator of sigma subunit)/PAS domain-containing protein